MGAHSAERGFRPRRRPQDRLRSREFRSVWKEHLREALGQVLSFFAVVVFLTLLAWGQSNAPIGEVFIITSGMLGAIIVLVVLVGGAKRLVGRARTGRQDLEDAAVPPAMSDRITGVAYPVAPAPTETQFLENCTIIAVSDIDGFSFSPDGRRVAICSWPSYGGVIQLFDTEAGTLIWRYRALLTPLEDVAFSPTGGLLATGSTVCRARILDAASGRRLREIAQHNGVVSGLAFSRDGGRLATGSSDGCIQISDVTTGWLKLQIKLERPPGLVIVFSPDISVLATGGDDGNARIWAVRTGQQQFQLHHGKVVTGVAFSPDGSLVATSGDDGNARIWAVRTGQQELQLHHGKVVTGVAFSPDGSLLATSGDDGFARIWDVRTGQQRLQLHHGKVVAGVAFSPDSRLVATSGYDKTLRIWLSPRFDTN